MNSPAIVAGGRQMPGWLKGGLVAALVFVGCWGGAISFWRMSEQAPSTMNAVLLLLGLPLLLLFALWGGRKLIVLRSHAPVAAAPSAISNVVAPRTASLAILATSLRAPHGASTEELAAAIADNKAWPNLDEELVDSQGLPVMTARCCDAKDDALKDEIDEWLAMSGMAAAQFSDEQWRALTLGTAVVDELATFAVRELLSQQDVPPTLQLSPILPSAWGADQRSVFGSWFKHLLTRSGWPLAKISLLEDVSALQDQAASVSIFSRLVNPAVEIDKPLITMVVACASHISEETIAKWEANDLLLTSNRAKGAIPGEGAAGLLMTDLLQAQLTEAETFAVLGAVEESRVDTAVDETRRASSKLLSELLERALKSAGVEAAELAMIVADSGQRSDRMFELMEYASKMMAHLNDSEEVVRVGIGSGTCDDVPFITALALGGHYALEREASIFCIGNENPVRRVAVLIQPSGKLA